MFPVLLHTVMIAVAIFLGGHLHHLYHLVEEIISLEDCFYCRNHNNFLGGHSLHCNYLEGCTSSRCNLSYYGDNFSGEIIPIILLKEWFFF